MANVFQDVAEHFLNVFYAPSDITKTDWELLDIARQACRDHRECTHISSRPMSAEQDGLVWSIRVEGEFPTIDAIYRDAENQIVRFQQQVSQGEASPIDRAWVFRNAPEWD